MKYRVSHKNVDICKTNRVRDLGIVLMERADNFT